MRTRHLIALSFGMKIVMVAFCASLFYAHRLFGQRYFNPGLSNSAQRRAARNAVNVDARNQEGLTGLMFAALNGEPVLAQALINQGASLNLTSNDSKKMTAVHYSANALRQPKSQETGYILLDGYASPRIKNKFGKTPLHLTVSTDILADRNKMVDQLVKNGARFNAQDNEGNTIMHIAASMKNASWIEMLMKTYGPLINLSLKNKKGLTPYGYGDSLGYTYVQEELAKPLEKLEKGTQRLSSGLTGLMIVIMRDSQKLLPKYVKDKAALNMKTDDQYGNSVLHVALLFENIPAIKMLVNKGASLTLRNSLGEVPAFYLVRMLNKNKMKRAAQLMIGKDPKTILAKNSRGNNLLHFIVLFNAQQLFDLLLKSHKDLIVQALKQKNLAFKTPFDLATQLKRPQLRKKLQALKEQLFIP